MHLEHLSLNETNGFLLSRNISEPLFHMVICISKIQEEERLGCFMAFITRLWFLEIIGGPASIPDTAIRSHSQGLQ